MTLSEVRRFLQAVATHLVERDAAAVKAALVGAKSEAVARGEQAEAKAIWCLEQVLDIQGRYLRAFDLLKHEEFYKAWCDLEQVEIRFVWLESHFRPAGDEYRLATIERLTLQLQELFPYAVFASAEIIAKEKQCTICGQKVSLRNPCGHRVGEIYDGEMCGREITDGELGGVSLTDKPANRYAVAFTGPEGERDHYDYSMLRELLARLQGPFDDWSVELSTAHLPHERYKDLGRNDSCPCSSELKYKHCCLKEPGVRVMHYQLWIGSRSANSPDPSLSWVKVRRGATREGEEA